MDTVALLKKRAGSGDALLDAAVDAIEGLRHDSDRYQQCMADLVGEIERLRTDKESLMVGRDFLIAEIESLRAAVERLREYARHKPECAYALWAVSDFDGSDEWEPCDCGYDALMVEVGETK